MLEKKVVTLFFQHVKNVTSGDCMGTGLALVYIFSMLLAFYA